MIRKKSLTAVVTSLAALMMLTGCQSSSSGDGGLGSSDTSTSSSSGASASKSTSKSASASPSASPSATGTQVVQIGGPDVPDTEDASVKAAYETVQQLNRLENNWGTDDASIKEFSVEDLKKFLDGEALSQSETLHAQLLKNIEAGEQPSQGSVRVGWIATDNAGKIEHKDKTYEHGSIQMRVCEDYSQVKNPDGSQSFPVEKSKRTMRVDVQRRADGYFYLTGYRVDHYGCH